MPQFLERKPVTTTGIPLPIPEEQNEHFMPFAFHPKVAREIKERDNWTCLCKEGRKDGLKLHASHKDHSRNNPYYNHIDNGTTLCLECHLREHIHLLQKADMETVDWAWHSVRLLAQEIWYDSFHTKGYQFKNKDTLSEDRKHLEEVFFSYDMDVFDFISNKEVR